MNKHTIQNADEAREAADKIVTLMQAVSELKIRKEAEKNALDKKYATRAAALEEEERELQKTLRNYLRKETNREKLFDKGTRSGHSTLARFGYRDTPRTLTALRGKLADIVKTLWTTNKRQYVRATEPKLSLDETAIIKAQLSDGQLADIGLKWSSKTNFYIEPINQEITSTSTTQA